jgi:D-sedoheptulose 7-phosphate isomerase
MNKNTDYIAQYLNEVKQICENIKQSDIEALIEAIRNLHGRLFIMGVGGSAANASHAVNDFRKILNIECYTPTDNVAELTARINDESWEDSYKNWLIGSKLNSNDAVLVLSVGGGSATTSKNLVKAMEYTRSHGATILSIVSRDGGKAKELSDVCVIIPVVHQDRITAHAEEWQGIVWHLIVNALQI